MELFKLFGRVLIEDDDAKKSLQKTDTLGQKVGKTLGSGIKTAAKFGAAMVAAGGLAVGAIVTLMKTTEEYRSDLSKLEQNARSSGNGFEAMTKELSYLNAITGETDSSIEALSNLMAAGFDDNQITSAVDALAGAVIKFPDTLKIEGLADGLQETLATGKAIGPFAELIERMGGDLDEFNNQMAGATTEAEKQQIAMNWLAESGLAEVNQQYKETNKDAIAAKEAQFLLNDSMAKMATALTPVIAKMTVGLVPIVEKFTGWITANMPMVEEIAEKAFASMSKGAEVLWDMMENYVLPAFVSILKWTSDNWPAIEKIIIGVFDAVKWTWNNVLQPTLTFLLELFGNIFDWAQRNFPVMKTTIQTEFRQIGEAVDTVIGFFSDLADGIQWALDKWNEWRNRPADDPKSPNQNTSGMVNDLIDSSDNGGGFRSFTDGSTWTPHAMGLDYVPYDGYRAILHKGEKVMTADENQRESQGSGVNITVESMTVRNDNDINRIAKELYALQRRTTRGVGFA